MEGSIGEVIANISKHICMHHILKSINFLGDRENNLTEVCVHEVCYVVWTQGQSDEDEDKVLGVSYHQ